MEIWGPLIFLGVVFFIVFWNLPEDSIKLPEIQLPWLPEWIQYIVVGFIWITAFALIVVAIVLFAFVVIHALWILSGAYFLRRSIRNTWSGIRTHRFFEENAPSWAEPEGETHNFEALGFQETHYNDTGESAPAEGDDAPDLEPLQRGHIRLLRPLQEAATARLLEYDMVQQPLSAAEGKYVALSYCNGSEPTRERIVVGGKLVKIRPNLHQALTALAKLAVDALCIKQSEPAEVEGQIFRMQAIFQQAKLVVAWINTSVTVLPRSSSNGYGTFNTSTPSNQDKPIDPGTQARAKLVLRNPYWHRLWIVQEFAVNRKILLLTTAGKLEEDELYQLVGSADTAVQKVYLEQVRNVIRIRKETQLNIEPHFVDLLMRTRTSFCKETLDRVFSIHSLAKDRRRIFTEAIAGLTTTTQELSQTMTRFYLRESPDSHLDIILLAPHFARSEGAPTWCPNFFKFDELPSDIRLVEYVVDVFGRLDSSSASPKSRLLFSATHEAVCTAEFNDDKILRTNSRRLGVICSLGWVKTDEGSPGFTTSHETSSAFDADGEDVATAFGVLLETLSRRDTLDTRLELVAKSTDPSKDDYKRSKYALTYFMLLVFGGQLEAEEAGGPEGWYAEWLHANQRFVFGKQTLRGHAREMTSVLGHERFWRWTEKFKDSLRASAGHGELRDWKRLHQPLRKIAQEHMRFMSIVVNGKGVLGLAHPGSRERDEVFLLPGCSVPVVLRKVPGTRRYTLIGDAVVPGAMFGEMWRSGPGGEFGSIEIS